MENCNNSSTKYLKTSPYTTLHSTVRGMGRFTQTQQSFRLHSESKGQQHESVHDKSKATQKLPMKEQSKPEFMLHTQLRAAKRAGFNDMIAAKMYLLERQKRLAERVQKIIEEEEVRSLRKEMIPRAQLMPFFDRPFFPQRSSRPLTIPKEPSFRMVNSKCCISSNEHEGFEKLRSKL